MRRWPVYVLAAPAFVAIWSGWVSIGMLTGFGVVKPFPGISDWELNTAITLPIGVEAYAAYAMYAWGNPAAGPRGRRFAAWSALGALFLGMVGQAASHILTAAGITRAPWPVVVFVSCLPVAVWGLGAVLDRLCQPVTDGAVSAVQPALVSSPQPITDHASEAPTEPEGVMIALPARILEELEGEGRTMADLTRALGRPRSTVAYHVERMIGAGEVDSEDGRLRVRATSNGH